MVVVWISLCILALVFYVVGWRTAYTIGRAQEKNRWETRVATAWHRIAKAGTHRDIEVVDFTREFSLVTLLEDRDEG